ncbi:hypothetical protein MKX01_027610 [Papaver californicum]|nr:hypothetical protein MKX01_027610 [Papaver californicum]
MCRFGILVVVILGLLSSTVQSIRFEIQSGHTKCISEEVKTSAMTVGNYHIVNPTEGHPLPESHKITVRVTSSFGNNLHTGDHVESGQFSFTAPETGDYMACFWAVEQKQPVTLTVDFEWKTGYATKDWTNVAKKGSVDVMEMELKKLEDTIQNIHEEMFYLREREEEMQEMNKSTTSRMAWLGFLSLFVCLSVASLQLWHLKSFFERKKLL